MISSAQEFIELRECNDPRAACDEAPETVWGDVLRLFPMFKEWVVRNKTVPVSILSHLAEDPDPRIRSEIATKRKCPTAVLERLARDPGESVRLRVAYNAKTPVSRLESLRRDASQQIVQVVEDRLNRLRDSQTV